MLSRPHGDLVNSTVTLEDDGSGFSWEGLACSHMSV